MKKIVLPNILALSASSKHVSARRRAVAKNTTLAVAASLTVSLAFGAQVDQIDLGKMLKDATALGAVRVMVTLDTIPIDSLRGYVSGTNTAINQKAKALIAELGRDALEGGYWSNGLGQIGVFVNPNGLRTLASTTNAKSFIVDPTQIYRSKAHGADGSLDAVEAELKSNGFAEVEVFLNNDEGEYDIGRDGKTTFRPSAALANEVAERVRRLQVTAFAKGINASIEPTPATGGGNIASVPRVKMRIDRNAFYGLRDHSDVRAIRPIKFADSRAFQFGSNVLESAKLNRSAEVLITLRGGETFSPQSGYMSAKAWKFQGEANKRAMDDVLSGVGVDPAAVIVTSHHGIGTVHVRLAHAALAQLFANSDPRILSVTLNRPIATASLTNSTQLLNMQPVWNLNYRGTGQNIVVIDSGVRRTHSFLTSDGSSPKVIFEACFGTTLHNATVDYDSICPGGSAANGWDSAIGTGGSGEPNLNAAACTALQEAGGFDQCSHGTHVAGIAAGRASALMTPTNLQGVAPDARLVSIQVFSYDTVRNRSSAFNADILAALDLVKQVVPLGSTGNPLIVNMSLGGGIYAATCDDVDQGITRAIADLTSRDVPVVVATGNAFNRNGIAFPSCVTGAIKVASVLNDAVGTSLSAFSNIGNPASYAGPILLAPGGGSGGSITSAGLRVNGNLLNTATTTLSGTSQAAPHVAGLYAVLKSAVPGIGLADVTGFLMGQGSIGVAYNLPAPVGLQAYRRVRLPF